ncbi:MAG TPA: phosphoribosylglycinamide synthetase C domain-containing protein, partial [Candidatus Nanopelagicaceae bacterium]
VHVFHAGTALKDDLLCSAGGRVLAVTGIDATLAAARNKAYQVISAITLPGSHYRGDIGLEAAGLEAAALAASTHSKVGEN